MHLRYFFDERSAAFFALGRIKSNGHKPVAVVTTSGTAVAELYPAVIEAHYTQSPLLLITADRPPSYRSSGSPQCIYQVGIFNHYAPTMDWSEGKKAFEWTHPIHINIGFDEPLLGKSSFLKPSESISQWPHFKAPLVVLGGVPEKYRLGLVETLKKINRPIYAEAFSGLREHPELSHLTLQAGSQSIDVAFRQGEFDSLLRVGSIPTLRFWRDLDVSQKNIPVHSVSHLPFSGLARVTSKPQDFESFLGEGNFHFNGGQRWLQWDIQKSRALKKLYQKFPNSEPSMVYSLSHQIASDEMVFLGNSLPIREWDLCASYSIPHKNIKANRGVNGIDGLVSSFLGAMNSRKKNWCLIGDLSAFYDLNALWFQDQHHPFCVVVINNKGGRIFSRMFRRVSLENRHSFHFKNWAQLFGLEYHLFSTKLDVSQVKTRCAIIELQPDNQQSEEFWTCYNQLFEDQRVSSC